MAPVVAAGPAASFGPTGASVAGAVAGNTSWQPGLAADQAVAGPPIWPVLWQARVLAPGLGRVSQICRVAAPGICHHRIDEPPFARCRRRVVESRPQRSRHLP